MSEENQEKPKGSVTIKLDYPIQWGEVDPPVTEITLTRPKGKHLKGIGKDVDMSALFAIASKISGHVPRFFDEMDCSDCMKVTEVIGDFLDSGPETGKTV